MDMLLVFEPCVTFVANPNPNLGVKTLTLGVHTRNPTEPKVLHMWVVAKPNQMLNLL
jgi:hypothetical protein